MEYWFGREKERPAKPDLTQNSERKKGGRRKGLLNSVKLIGSGAAGWGHVIVVPNRSLHIGWAIVSFRATLLEVWSQLVESYMGKL